MNGAETIEKVVDILNKVPRWKRRLIRFLWPEIEKIADTLREYCWR